MYDVIHFLQSKYFFIALCYLGLIANEYNTKKINDYKRFGQMGFFSPF